jgi:hypothetical protein
LPEGHQNVEIVSVYLLKTGGSVNIISRVIGRGSRRRRHSYKPNSPKRSHPKLHLLPVDQPDLQPGVFARERRLMQLSTSLRKNDSGDIL